jgi:hypothetical protein
VCTENPSPTCFHSHLPLLIPESFLKISPFILDNAGIANNQIVMDSKNEWGHKTAKPSLAALEVLLHPCWNGLTTASLLLCPKTPSTSSFDPSSASVKQLNGVSQADWKDNMEPLVPGTIKAAAACLAATFWDNCQPSPLHILGSQSLHPSFKALFKAFENADRPTKRQKAMPRPLRKFLKASHHSSLLDTARARGSRLSNRHLLLCQALLRMLETSNGWTDKMH